LKGRINIEHIPQKKIRPGKASSFLGKIDYISKK
jgi:hypothetical protein